MTYQKLASMTQSYRKSIGLEAKTMPEELKSAAKELEQRTKDVELLKEDLAKYRGEIIDVEPYPAEIEKQLAQKQVDIADAERQLFYAKGRYETELAKWRASTPT